MMFITPALIKSDFATELASETDERIQRFIGYAVARLSQIDFGVEYDYAVAYMTAHMMTLANRGGAGEVKSETVGKISVSYAVADSSPMASELTMTSYGRLLLGLRQSLVTAMVL